MTPLIFGVGVNKSGTTSLAAALRLLGFRVLHDYQRGQRIVWSLLSGEPDPLLEQYDAFLDAPFWKAIPQIEDRFGTDARYILHTRDREAWITSRLIHVLHDRVCPEGSYPVWTEVSTIDSRAEWFACHDLVQSHLGSDPRLLTLDITRGDGWSKLCEWLGRPIPPVPFPHENGGRERLERILTRSL